MSPSPAISARSALLQASSAAPPQQYQKQQERQENNRVVQESRPTLSPHVPSINSFVLPATHSPSLPPSLPLAHRCALPSSRCSCTDCTIILIHTHALPTLSLPPCPLPRALTLRRPPKNSRTLSRRRPIQKEYFSTLARSTPSPWFPPSTRARLPMPPGVPSLM